MSIFVPSRLLTNNHVLQDVQLNEQPPVLWISKLDKLTEHEPSELVCGGIFRRLIDVWVIVVSEESSLPNCRPDWNERICKGFARNCQIDQVTVVIEVRSCLIENLSNSAETLLAGYPNSPRWVDFRTCCMSGGHVSASSSQLGKIGSCLWTVSACDTCLSCPW